MAKKKILDKKIKTILGISLTVFALYVIGVVIFIFLILRFILNVRFEQQKGIKNYNQVMEEIKERQDASKQLNEQRVNDLEEFEQMKKETEEFGNQIEQNVIGN